MNYHLKKANPNYTITSLCFGQKYAPIFSHWLKNTISKCPTADILLPLISPILPFPPDEVQWLNNRTLPSIFWTGKGEAFWDVLRLENNIDLLSIGKPVVHCDLDMIIVKDLEPLIHWGESQKIDIIFSKETWGDPLPICSGLYVLYPSSIDFCKKLLTMMKMKKYGTYSDQNTLRSYIIESGYTIENVSCVSSVFDGLQNIVITTPEGIRICILDMDIITRDPMQTKRQYANHVNVDNVGGVSQFIRFFYERIEDLPLTCRCGKKHLGNTEKCIHTSYKRKN